MRGIHFDGKHSWHEFHAVISACEKPVPEKKLVEETVPYSNVTYDFSCLNGKQTYKDRTLKYTFTLLSSARHIRQKYHDFVRWLYTPSERIPLRDDEEEGYHYLAKCTAISKPEYKGGTCKLTVTFTAYPLRIPDRPPVIYTEETAPWPDVNFDGSVDAADAAMILAGVAEDGAGGYAPFTDEQKRRADANRDGSIDASDVALVLAFVSECGAGHYADSPQGWVQFLNDFMAGEEGII